jgi:hypothetical protein
MRRPFRGRRQTLQLKTLTRPVSASFTEQVSSRQRLLATALHLAPCHIFEATHDEIRRLCVKARNPNRNPCRVSRVAVTHRVLIPHIYFQTSGALILRPLIVPIERLSLQNCSSHLGNRDPLQTLSVYRHSVSVYHLHSCENSQLPQQRVTL